MILALLLVAVMIFATGCGGSGGSAGSDAGSAGAGGSKKAEQAASEAASEAAEQSASEKAAEQAAEAVTDEANAAEEKAGKSGSDDGFKPGKFKDAKFNESKAEGNEEVQVDVSSAAKGYIALVCNSDARVKLQVVKGEDTYTYDVVMKKPQIFPLQSGNGDYTIKVMKNLEGNKYFELYKTDISVKLKDKFGPYLRPSQYADFTKESDCVKEAAKLAEKAGSEQELVDAIYDFI